MSESMQSFSSHGRYDPPFHFFVIPVFAITLIAAIVQFVRGPGLSTGWFVILIAASVVAVFKSRLSALRVQDRVIRLEERLRLASLVDTSWRPHIAELTESQLIGLRFASDAELPELAARALSEKMSRSDVKAAIKQWRPDHWRV